MYESSINPSLVSDEKGVEASELFEPTKRRCSQNDFEVGKGSGKTKPLLLIKCLDDPGECGDLEPTGELILSELKPVVVVVVPAVEVTSV